MAGLRRINVDEVKVYNVLNARIGEQLSYLFVDDMNKIMYD
jgi:hypothetical protein